MRAVDLIAKKRDGLCLTDDEISFLIRGFTQGDIPEYQMSAFLMACYFQQLTFDETLQFTREMLDSGKTLDLSSLSAKKVDKHSTGGVGDKTSLILSPVVAACGVAVPMISGRGLGHTGGTVDKFEAIPGFRMDPSLKDFKRYLSKSLMAMMSQTPEIAPADKKMYALRDVTATVECIPLITASIMSKKLAEGTDGLVLDVKFGHGAFMKKYEDAKMLAEWLVRMGKGFNKKTVAVLSNMDQPLGNQVGNSLEVQECIDVMKGKGPADVTELSLTLAGHMICIGGAADSLDAGKACAKKVLESGEALEKFKELIAQQGGDPKVVEDATLLPRAASTDEYKAPTDIDPNSRVTVLNAKEVGLAATLLGCGRSTVKDVVDPAVGFTLHKKVGDPVAPGETLLTIHYNDEKKRALAVKTLDSAYRFGTSRESIGPLIRETIGE